MTTAAISPNAALLCDSLCCCCTLFWSGFELCACGGGSCCSWPLCASPLMQVAGAFRCACMHDLPSSSNRDGTKLLSGACYAFMSHITPCVTDVCRCGGSGLHCLWFWHVSAL
jgi:hypothetical protein